MCNFYLPSSLDEELRVETGPWVEASEGSESRHWTSQDDAGELLRSAMAKREQLRRQKRRPAPLRQLLLLDSTIRRLAQHIEAAQASALRRIDQIADDLAHSALSFRQPAPAYPSTRSCPELASAGHVIHYAELPATPPVVQVELGQDAELSWSLSSPAAPVTQVLAHQDDGDQRVPSRPSEAPEAAEWPAFAGRPSRKRSADHLDDWAAQELTLDELFHQEDRSMEAAEGKENSAALAADDSVWACRRLHSAPHSVWAPQRPGWVHA